MHAAVTQAGVQPRAGQAAELAVVTGLVQQAPEQIQGGTHGATFSVGVGVGREFVITNLDQRPRSFLGEARAAEQDAAEQKAEK